MKMGILSVYGINFLKLFLDAWENIITFCKKFFLKNLSTEFQKKDRKTAYIHVSLHTPVVSFCFVPLSTAFEKSVREYLTDVFDILFSQSLTDEIFISLNKTDLKRILHLKLWPSEYQVFDFFDFLNLIF